MAERNGLVRIGHGKVARNNAVLLRIVRRAPQILSQRSILPHLQLSYPRQTETRNPRFPANILQEIVDNCTSHIYTAIVGEFSNRRAILASGGIGMLHAKLNAPIRRCWFRHWHLAAISATLALAPRLSWAEDSPNLRPAVTPVRVIGATALVTEVSSGVRLPARVDTGAMTCSVHCDAFEIPQASVNPKENIGKPIRFRTKDADGKPKWVRTKVADYVVVKTADRNDERYKVLLRLRCDDVEKKVMVTLNNREKMTYPMLLGRNFLCDDFLVNVGVNDDK